MSDYIIPSPILDKREQAIFNGLTYKYIQVKKPGTISKFADKLLSEASDEVKFWGKGVKKTISENELYNQCMKIVVEGFKVIEEKTAKHTISRETIIQQVDQAVTYTRILDLDEICLIRCYDIENLITFQKYQNLAFMLLEGSATGVLGFAGMPFNLVLSTFLLFRAVQSIAMFYGYDVVNSKNEMIIASQIFMKTLCPEDESEFSQVIEKIMMLNFATAFSKIPSDDESVQVKENTKELFSQLNNLAEKYSGKAIENVGQKTFEEKVFKELFEQIGKKIAKSILKKTVPVVSLATGALIDTIQMKKLIDYARIFYCKRFIAEKEKRIKELFD